MSHPTDADVWRHKSERAELVERVIRYQAEVRSLRAALVEIAELEGDRPLYAYCEALLARIRQQDSNVERLVAENERLTRKQAA